MDLEFKDKEAKKLFDTEISKKYRAFQKQALDKLFAIQVASKVEDLIFPSGNRLEKLKGDRKDEWSIRINKQWRICFKVDGHTAYDIKIEDYH